MGNFTLVHKFDVFRRKNCIHLDSFSNMKECLTAKPLEPLHFVENTALGRRISCKVTLEWLKFCIHFFLREEGVVICKVNMKVSYFSEKKPFYSRDYFYLF